MKRLNVWRDCTLCMGAGRFDDGLEAAWDCSACRGRGQLCDSLPPFFEAVQTHVLGYSIRVKNLTVGVWSHAERQASLCLQHGEDAGYWLARAEQAAAQLKQMEARP
jgi:hypothetical protein